MKNHIVFDIETSPLPLETVSAIMPEFKADGRLKDEAKILADIEGKREDWLANGALAAERGRVLVIGVKPKDKPIVYMEGDEADILAGFWDEVITEGWTNTTFAGHNILGFDLPFMVRRSWVNGIEPPHYIMDALRAWNGSPEIFDTMRQWALGDRKTFISLDTIAWSMGAGRTYGDGADFHKLYATDKPEAMKHLETDLTLTEKVFLRMSCV